MTIATTNVNTLLTRIAQVVRSAPDATLRNAVMRAAREFCRQTQCVRETITGATVAGDVLYQLGNDEGMGVVGVFAVSIRDAAGNTRGLSASDSSQWDPNAGRDVPTRYQYAPPARVALYPTPDAAYTLHVSAIVAPLEDGTAVPDALLEKWREGVEAGALAYLHSIPGMPWSSPVEAMTCQKKFQSEISNAKADVARSFNVGSVRVRPRTFGAGMRR